MKKYMKIMGCKVQDRVTGFIGVVTSIGFDLYGCVQCVVTPSTQKDGKLEDSRWFYHKRLEVLDGTPVMPLPDFLTEDPQQPAKREQGPQEKPHSDRW